MTEKPKRFVFDLSGDDKAVLEAARVKLGLRSHAETLRALIRSTAPEPQREWNGMRIAEAGKVETVLLGSRPADYGSRLKKR